MSIPVFFPHEYGDYVKNHHEIKETGAKNLIQRIFKTCVNTHAEKSK
jgi:hypothetical protein